MKFSFLVFSLLFSSLALAEDNMKDPLVGIRVSREEISQSLEMMKSSGKISAADYESAKRELSSLSENKIDDLNNKAIGLVRKDPDKAVSLYSAGQIDTKEVEKALSELDK